MTNSIDRLYRDYTNEVSPEPNPIRIELANYLLGFLDAHPEIETVADLGSGFSSVVFRWYSLNSRPLEIVSVDDSQEWLSKAEEFCRNRNLYAPEFKYGYYAPGKFDLVLYDLGDFDTRKRYLPVAASMARKFLIVDDANNTEYQKIMLDLFRSDQITPLTETLDDYRKYSWLIETGG